MSLEGTKSIVLFLLVSLSLILTWGMWTYQPQYPYSLNTEEIKSVAIGEKRQFNEVIKPFQYIYHQNGRHYKMSDHMNNSEIYNMAMDLNITEADYIQYSSSEELNAQIRQNGSIEMIFPTSLPMELTNYILDPIQEEWEVNSFDRIILSLDKEPSLSVVSINTNEIIKMKIEDTAIDHIKQKIMIDNNPTLYTVDVGKGQSLYLPEKKVVLNQLSFSIQTIVGTEFKDALFTDPSQVKQFSLNNDEESYTDGLSALEITNNHRMMSFINPANIEINPMDAEELILKSIEFINDHSGWTDAFSLASWDQRQQIVEFGLTIHDYPVFDLINQNETTTVYQSWKDSEIYEYKRSLVNLRFNLEKDKKQIVLPSGRELLSYLTRTKPGFNLSHLENAIIGFSVTNESINTDIMTVQPSWFIRYNGIWEEIQFPIGDQGGR